ncbi:hypothetical protein VN97_g13211, partial [Penicillium thymicola]
MAFRSPARGQEWRNSARPELPLWTTSFDHTHSQIPKAQPPQTLPHSDSTTLKYTSLDSGSAYEPPSSPPDSPKAVAHRVPTRSQTSCAPSAVQRRSQSPDSSGSNSNQAIGHKRASTKLHPPHLPNEQVINGTREIIKATRPGITMRNFAPNDVYSDCSLAIKAATNLYTHTHTQFINARRLSRKGNY